MLVLTTAIFAFGTTLLCTAGLIHLRRVLRYRAALQHWDEIQQRMEAQK